MKVEVKDLYADIELKTRGMELCVRDNDGSQIGDLVVSKTGLTWCEGRTLPKNGLHVSWNEFREWMMSD